MNRLAIAFFAIFMPVLLVLLLPFMIVEAVHENATLTSSSPWLSIVANPRPRPSGCMSRPWICSEGEHPPTARMRCCRNQCVDVSSDDTHCGICGLRCPFTWQCCRGICINTNISPFNCGRCGNRCPFRVPCLYGMCGYVEPPPPRPPRPPHPPRPWPPHPPLPPRPWPPHPPRPPRPWPPHPPQPPGSCPPHPPRPWPPGLPHPPHLRQNHILLKEGRHLGFSLQDCFSLQKEIRRLSHQQRVEDVET